MTAPDATGPLGVGLVGGGRGGAALLELILGYPPARLLVVADPDPGAPALARARALGIPTASHHLDVFRYPLRLVLEVTGRPEVLADLVRAKPTDVEVIGAGSLRFFWDLLQDNVVARSRLVEEAERRRREAEVLADVGRSISESLDVDTVLQRATEAARNLTASAVSLIALREGDSETFTFRYLAGARTEGYRALRVAPGKGSGGQVLLTGRPFRTENYLEDPRISSDFRAVARDEGTVAGMVVPIRIEGRMEGLLYVHDRAVRHYTDHDEAVLLQLANYAAVAIGNARLYQAAHERARELRTLHDITTRLAATLDPAHVLDAVADGALALSGARRCVVFELDPSAGLLHPRASRGLAAEAVVPAMRLGFGAAGSAALRRELIFSADLERQPLPGYDERWEDSGATLGDLVRRRGWRAALAAPLLSKDTVLGSILVLWDRPHDIGDAELRVVTGLGRQAAVALEHAQLYAAQRRRAQEAEALLEIARAMSSTMDLTPLLKDVSRRTAQALAMDRCSIFLLEEGRVRPVMSQFADGHEAPELWRAFRRRQASRLEDMPAFAEAVRRALPVRIDDATSTDLLDRWWVETFGLRSVAVVPLVRQDTTIGILHLDNSTERPPIGPEQMAFAMTIASQIALTVDNARLYREVRRKLRTTEGLLAVARALGGSLEVHELARQAARELTRLVGADTSVFFEHDEAARQSRPVAGYRVPPAMRDPSYRLAMADAPPFFSEGVTSGRPVASADVGDDPRFDHPAVRAAPLRPRSFLFTPVVSKGRFLGAVLTHWWHERHEFTEEELALAAAVASQLAVALDNARLFAETQRALVDLKVAQDRLVRGETLRALGEVAGGAAHHLNNLLAVVVGRVQLLQRNSLLQRHADAEPVRRALAIVERAARDGADVVRRIQTFARTPIAEELRPVDLDHVVSDVVEMTRGRWQDAMIAHGLQLEVVPELGRVPPVLGNEAELREVVTNVLINAIEACPGGGRISLATRTDERGVVLVVTDTGAGMPDDVRRKAFEPFFTTKGVKSTGLGLSVTHGIVRRHGGEIEIDGRPGAGTAVTIRLRIAPEATAAVASPASSSPVGALRVLVVDDEPEVREIVAEMLGADGHQTWQAAAGADALAMLESGTAPDLVLTDLGMPLMTGWELAAAIKVRWPAVRVALMTGWGDDATAGPERRPAVEFILPKPVTCEALRAALGST